MGTDRDSNTEHSSTSENGSAGDKDDLAVRLSELARELQSEQTPNDILEDLVRAAVQIIPGVDEASISMIIERKQVESRAPTSDLPVQVDALQMEVRQGPCLDAVFKEQTVLVSDTSSDPRWPEFGKRAYALGARSMLSFQLYVEGDNLGALNLYGRETGAFTEESKHVGLLVAAHAAVAFADAQKIGQYQQAMDTRDLIGQAKGILMERYKITAQQAFVILTKASSLSNVKLRDVAIHLASTGEIITQ